jgi:thiamine biosynthesis lipoprotein
MTLRQSNFEAIGTHWRIQVQDKVSDVRWHEIMQSIHLRIENFDKTYSRFRADSLVTRMAQEAGQHEIPDDGYKLMSFYENLYKATEGKVTPLIGQVISDAGYDSSYSFKSKRIQHPPTWENVISYNKRFINLHQPALLDFGAAGKGYLVDIIAKILESQQLYNFIIDASGDVLHRSKPNKKLEIGLENPLDSSEAIGIAQLSNKSLCASAGSKRKWNNFNHIVDPIELRSPQEIIATWVIADNTMTGDGLATALFFTDAEKLLKQFSFSYAVLNKHMQLSYAKDFPLKIFQKV